MVDNLFPKLWNNAIEFSNIYSANKVIILSMTIHAKIHLTIRAYFYQTSCCHIGIQIYRNRRTYNYSQKRNISDQRTEISKQEHHKACANFMLIIRMSSNIPFSIRRSTVLSEPYWLFPKSEFGLPHERPKITVTFCTGIFSKSLCS